MRRASEYACILTASLGLTSSMETALRSHILRRDSMDVDFVLPQVLSLSNQIFSADLSSKYASLPIWKERLSHESSMIIYLTAPTQDGGIVTAVDKPIAFLFLHPRMHSPPWVDGTKITLHIWLAGVLPYWRKAGCLHRMMKEVMTAPDSTYTICTSPSLFPDMWTWLLRRGWKREISLGEDKVMLSKRSDPVQHYLR